MAKMHMIKIMMDKVVAKILKKNMIFSWNELYFGSWYWSRILNLKEELC